MPQLWKARQLKRSDTTAKQMLKYNIRQITKTLTNTKYQTANKCQTDDPSPKCQLKYTENELKFQNTKEQMITAAKPPGFAAD